MDWNDRFAGAQVGVPGPPEALIGRLELVPPGGRALDAACGRGTVAVWLAQRAFAVDAVDAAPAGLALGAELAAREDVTVNWVQADLEAGLPPSTDEGPYDVVVCQRYRDPALYPALAAALAPAGLLVVTVLCQVGGAGGRFRAAPGELRAAFGRLEVLADEEGGGRASLVARAR